MKVCEYCDGLVEDNVTTCPHCSGTAFAKKCGVCGTIFQGAECPQCQHARIAAEEQRRKRAQAEKANTGLGWKTALTVFLPFIGGFFLIKDEVKSGFRYFAIVWCCLMAISVAMTTGTEAGARVASSLLCLAPVGLYLFRKKDALQAAGTKGKAPIVAFCAVLLLTVGGLAVNGGNQTEEPTEATRANTTVVAPTPAATPSASAASSAASSSGSQTEPESPSGAAGEASSSSSAASILKDATLSVKTETLEYSNKQADPLKYVACDLEGAQVTADGTVDLTAVGTYAVVYTIAYGGQTKTQTVEYTVRDTKAPEISFVKKKRTIDQGESFDPRDNIEYVKDKVEGTLVYVDEEPPAQEGHKGTDRIYDSGWYTIEGDVDSSTPGTYNLLVRASDKHGNVKTREMPIVVKRVEQEPAPTAAEHTYIVNTNSHKFHLTGCRDVKNMSDANKWETTTTREELINSGYSPCMHCNP